MTFLDREQSNYRGEPILLYEFRRGAMRAYYASSDRDVPSSAGTFLACPISNGGVAFKGMAVTDQFEITAPADIDPATWFAYSPPSDTVFVVVRRFHWGDPFSAIVYIGQIVSVTHTAEETVAIKCQPTSITLKRGGLRMSWTRGCQHALYDQNCQADKEVFGITRHINFLFAASFTVTEAFPSGYWWPGGIVQWEISPGTFERRLIQDVSTGIHEVTPYGQMDGYTIGMTVRLYPGCKRTMQWCDTFFNNRSNYGGFQFMPNRSPYDGDTVF